MSDLIAALRREAEVIAISGVGLFHIVEGW